MEPLALAGLLSVISNRIIEAFVRPIKENMDLGISWWWLIYPSAVLGFVLSYLAGLNLMVDYLPDNLLIGQIVTGIAVGFGANLLDVFNQ